MPESVVTYGEMLPDIPGRLAWEEPRSHLVREGSGYAVEPGRRSSKALLVNRLRDAVSAWRAASYPSASEVTADLFRYWFEDDHERADGSIWRYHFGQREAVETLAYLVE